LKASDGQAVKSASPAVGPVGEEGTGYPARGGLAQAGAVTAEAGGTQLTQCGARGEVAVLAGSFGLTTGDFGQDVCAPTSEPGDIVAFVDEVIGPQLFRFAEKGIADEGQEDVLAQLA